jgi:CXXX repeat peptide maturase
VFTLTYLKQIVVILDAAAVSFCYYKNPVPSTKSKLISLSRLKQITEFAEQQNYSINFIYGNKRPSRAYEKIIEASEHVKIAPLNYLNIYKDCVYVINDRDIPRINKIPNNGGYNINLRLSKKKLTQCASVVATLAEKCSRLNLYLLDLDTYTEEELQIYGEQLRDIEQTVLSVYQSGKNVEFGFISDRLVLSSMRNCDAGLSHITFAPNGKFYICPGFYHDYKNHPLGTVARGIEIKNQRLLQLENAVICSFCDAYHCKRCFYLNKKITGEIATPSHQQCVSSHLERESSRIVREGLEGLVENVDKLQEVPKLNYLDPIEVAEQNYDKLERPEEKGVSLAPLGLPQPVKDLREEESLKKAEKFQKPEALKHLTNRDLLERIYLMQKELLERLASKG